MKKLALISCLFLLPVSSFAMNAQEAFVSIIHTCKNKDIYNEFKKNADKEEQKKQNCFCKAFSDMSEGEIYQKLELAWDYGIPQYDMFTKMAEAYRCAGI